MRQKSMTVNLIANGIKTLMSVLFPLITFPYASRILGASGIGKVDYARSIIAYFALMASLGIGTYAVREGARIRDNKEKFDKFAQEILHINLVTTGIAYVFLFIFLRLPILQEYHQLLIISGASILCTTVGMEWLFTIKEEYQYITIRAILFQILSLVLMFLLVRSHKDYAWYAALTVISSGGSAIMNLFYSRRFVTWRNKKKCEYRKHLKPIFLIFGTSLASSIYMHMDTTMLGAIQGDVATGIYSAAVKVNAIVGTLIGTISATILPRVSYYIGNDMKKEYEGLMKVSMDILLLISVPAAIGMMCTSDILILLFSGEEFMSGTTAAKILSARVIVGAVNRVLAYQVCTPYKKDKEVLVSTGGGAAFNLIANVILIPIYGVTGAAIATFFSEIVVFLILMYYSGKILDVKRFYHRGIIYLIGSIPFFGIRLLAGLYCKNIVLVLGITVLGSMLLYFGILLIVRDPYLSAYKNKVLNKRPKSKR